MCTRSQTYLCSEENCKICLSRSLLGHQAHENWSDKNETTPRMVIKTMTKIIRNEKYWFYCQKCQHHDLITTERAMTPGWCRYCVYKSNKFCSEDECDFCKDRSFASMSKSIYWSEKNELRANQIGKNVSLKFWFSCPDCLHEVFTTINSVNRYKVWCYYCNKKQKCENSNCETCKKQIFADHPMAKYYSKKNETPIEEVSMWSKTEYYWFDCFDCGHEVYTRCESLVGKNTKVWCKYCSNVLICGKDCTFCLPKTLASHEKMKFYSLRNKDDPKTITLGNTKKKYWFWCDKCFHEFDIHINNMNSGEWCSYCANKRLCECEDCFNKSFASHPRVKNLSKKNGDINPKQIRLFTNKKFF